MCLGQFDRLGEHPAALQRCRRQHDFGAQETHHLAAFDTEVLGHGYDERVAFLRTHHGETDAGIAAGGFDNGLARLQCTGLFRVFDDAEREAILDRTHRVEGLDFDVQVDAFRCELVEADDWRPTDGLQDIVEALGHGDLPRSLVLLAEWPESIATVA